jgi:hypothetical protein
MDEPEQVEYVRSYPEPGVITRFGGSNFTVPGDNFHCPLQSGNGRDGGGG